MLDIANAVWQLRGKHQKEDIQMNQNLNDVHSLSHTRWNCKYHVVFAPKYRRKDVLWCKTELEIGTILRAIVSLERSTYHRGRGVSRSHTYASGNTT